MDVSKEWCLKAVGVLCWSETKVLMLSGFRSEVDNSTTIKKTPSPAVSPSCISEYYTALANNESSIPVKGLAQPKMCLSRAFHKCTKFWVKLEQSQKRAVFRVVRKIKMVFTFLTFPNYV